MQEFEKYPKLTEYIQEMANTGRTPREWTDFLYQLNQALRQPPVSGSLQDRLFELANDFAVDKQGDVAVKLHSIHNGL